MKNLKDHTLKQFTDVLSKKVPTPGGGSAAALGASLGVSLLLMVSRYSKGRSKNKVTERQFDRIIKDCEKIRLRLLTLVDTDAKAYQGLIQAKTKSAKIKKQAQRRAHAVPKEVSQLCFKAIRISPVLVKKGNPYLLSDVEVALELISASYNSSLALMNANA